MTDSEVTKTNKVSNHKIFIMVATGLGSLIVLIGVFALGVKVGFKEAKFTQDWQREYPNNFGDFKGLPLPLPGSQNGQFFNAHGIFGTILSKDSSSLIIKGMDNNEKTVVISAQTYIRKNFDDLTFADLKVNDAVTVIGSPNEKGQIDAKFIRVLNEQK